MAEHRHHTGSEILVAAYSDISHAIDQAQQLDQSLANLLAAPSTSTLAAAQQAWRQAYDAYLGTLIYANLPIQDPKEWHNKGIHYERTLSLLDSWPIEGGYIDYVPGYPFSGIVNDLTLALDEDTLMEQHGFSDPSYASLGFHALEFMLWGDDGQRSHDDFIARQNTAPILMPSEGRPTDEDERPEENTGPVIEPEVQNHMRRRQYLQLLSDQLQNQLRRLQRRWHPSNGHYAQQIQNMSPKQQVYALLIATQTLLTRELLGRRLEQNSSPYSHTHAQDVAAVMSFIPTLLLPAQPKISEESSTAPPASQNDPQGLYAILTNKPQDRVLEQWQEHHARIRQALETWQKLQSRRHELDKPVLIQQLHQHIVELLALLQQTARRAGVELPKQD